MIWVRINNNTNNNNNILLTGFFVYAGVLFSEKDGAKNLIKKNNNSNQFIKIIPLDVTNRQQVEHAVDVVRLDGYPLWAVVNNAGIAISTPWDWGDDLELYQRQFDVNTFGMIRVTKSFIPLLRKSKGGGRVVNVASLAGRHTLPYMGAYCISKHSVRVFCDSLRRDMLLTDHDDDRVKIICVEPTFYQTPITNQQQLNRMRMEFFGQTPKDIACYYQDDYYSQSPTDDNNDDQKGQQRQQQNQNQSSINIIKEKLQHSDSIMFHLMRDNIEEVVDTLIRAITLANPKPYYRCMGLRDYLHYYWLYYLPETVYDTILYFVYKYFY